VNAARHLKDEVEIGIHQASSKRCQVICQVESELTIKIIKMGRIMNKCDHFAKLTENHSAIADLVKYFNTHLTSLE
jgi:hypothetical protein